MLGGISSMSRQAWLTPDDAPGTLVCHQVFVPAGMEYEAALKGALLLLAEVHNWEKVGTSEPQDIADAFFAAFMATVDAWEVTCE